MIFAGKPEKLNKLLCKTVNIYAPEHLPMTPRGRFLDRIKVSDVHDTYVSGMSLVTGQMQTYNAEDGIQFFDAYKDDLFRMIYLKEYHSVTVKDLYEGEK